MRRVALLACGVAALAGLAGCGLGPGEERAGAGVDLRVTRDFGSELLLAEDGLRIREDETAMRLLRANADVKTRFGGGFVQSIGEVSGRVESGTSDWFYYVNGIEADEGAADFELSPGDVVQWDHRDWRATMDVRTIVGAFPQPFLDGYRGKRLPVRVECEDVDSQPCRTVKQRLREEGVSAGGASLGAPGNQRVARVVVAAWSRARQLPTARLIELGPRRSGVFARFVDEGEGLELLGADGRRISEQRAGAGLVAALRPTDDELVWLVTGTDDQGVVAAADALRASTLRNAFSVVAADGRVQRLPLEGGTGEVR
jgi:hypothetical protein